MDYKYFHDSIKNMIEKMAYDFYVIKPFMNITCPCVNAASEQANPDCHMCLGTGHKIAIKKIRGASNDVESNVSGKSVKGSSAVTVGRTYFVDKKYSLGNNDIIIDGDEILYVYRTYRMKAFNGEHTHDEVQAIPKRNDHEKILKNFKKIIEKHKQQNK